MVGQTGFWVSNAEIGLTPEIFSVRVLIPDKCECVIRDDGLSYRFLRVSSHSDRADRTADLRLSKTGIGAYRSVTATRERSCGSSRIGS